MCPTKLADPFTLEASSDPEDWGVCSKDCNLKHYRTNQQIYDQVNIYLLSNIYSWQTLFTADCVAESESLLDLPALHNWQLRPGPASDRPQDLRGREVTAEAAQAYGEDIVIMMML